MNTTFEAKLCSFKQEQVQGYFEANAFMNDMTSLKDIFAIEHGQVCLDPPKYDGKSMRHYKAYKRTIEYTLREHPFMYCTNKEKCMYVGQFLIGIPAEHWKTMETQIKESPTLKFDYEAFIEMLKKRLLAWKVCQIKVGTKLKSLCQRDSQTLSEFINHLEALKRDIEPPSTDAQRHQNLLYSMHNYLWQVLVYHNKVGTTQENLEEAARSMELMEPAPVGMQKTTSVVTFSAPAATSTNQNARWALYSPKAKNMICLRQKLMRDQGILAFWRFACDSHFRQPIAKWLSPASPISNGLSGKKSQLRRYFQLGKDHRVLGFQLGQDHGVRVFQLGRKVAFAKHVYRCKPLYSALLIISSQLIWSHIAKRPHIGFFVYHNFITPCCNLISCHNFSSLFQKSKTLIKFLHSITSLSFSLPSFSSQSLLYHCS